MLPDMFALVPVTKPQKRGHEHWEHDISGHTGKLKSKLFP
jgi:hypothetical protein